MTARSLARHFAEFLEYAKFHRKTYGGSGFERDKFLKHVWRDGVMITRPEYEMLIGIVKEVGTLDNRRKGRSGDVPIKEIGLSVPAQPSQDNLT